MSITETERELIQEVIASTANETAKRVVAEMLSIHVETCPHGRRLNRYTLLCVGAAFGLGAACGDLWPMVTRVLGL